MLPNDLRILLADRPYTLDTVGMSGSDVLCFDDMVLKIGDYTPAHDHELSMLTWMNTRSLPVPRILYAAVENGRRYLLMSRIPGKMSCDDEYLDNPATLLEILAEGMHLLWKTDITGCPVTATLPYALQAAEKNVTKGRVTHTPDGFSSPEAALAWLYDNRPDEHPVLSHGDYCLPNIFAESGRFSGFIDLGTAGLADPYQDIADCRWSYLRNMNGTFGGRVRPCDPDRLFDVLGIPKDTDRLYYYDLLNELFC